MKVPANPAELRCWILTDGNVGMLNQCRGLAAVMGVEPISKVIGQRKPWRWLPPAITPASLSILKPHSDKLEPPWPDLLISSGRKSVAPARAIRKLSRGKSFCVQIQDPGISPNAFDLVVTPEHDGLSGPNVISTMGSMHSVNAQALAAAREAFAGRVAHLPRPLLAVLLGGDNSVYRMTAAFSRKLAEDLARIARSGEWGLAVTPSRRTPDQARRTIRDALIGTGADVWDEQGDNPYLGFLAHADAIVVTCDSVNMVSEAAATGKPLHVAHLEGGSAKFRRFHNLMESRGISRPFQGRIEQWDYTPPDETTAVAAEVLRRIAIG